jgi:hypothetical protein
LRHCRSPPAIVRGRRKVCVAFNRSKALPITSRHDATSCKSAAPPASERVAVESGPGGGGRFGRGRARKGLV